tara:strand:+ start:5281 stop:6177 length:897 start_codon:yes stop_codon:yes gene_type:complete
MSNKIIELGNKLKSKIFLNYNVGKHTWFRAGGNAKIFAIVENNLELEIILNEINNENFYILGSGSNLLIRDIGFDGAIIKLGKEFNTINKSEDKIEVGSSVLDVNLSKFALKQGIEGFEFFSGIPGSVGGAVKMNAGCYGHETKDIIKYIEIYDHKLQKKIINKDKLNLNYRSSDLKDTQIILKVIFNLKYGDQNMIKEKIINIKEKRLLSQPIKYKTSGSTFKNPTKMYAAKLIEEAGCKGMKYGNAIVSNQHANFLINRGGATATDIENLGKLVIDKVYKKFNIILDWEIKIIGDQ